MTIKAARRVLGKDAHGVSDADLKRDIGAATFLKDIFFNFTTKDRKTLAKSSSRCHNMAVYEE